MLVSVIIPCFNVEGYVVECVESVFFQTYSNIEVICIDNNSTDSTWQKLEQLKKQNPTLIIENEPKSGAPAARNKGVSLAKGNWIQFLDADDLLLPNKIKHQVELINENCSFIAGACIKLNVSGEQTTVYPSNSDTYKSLFLTQLGNTCSNLWNKSYLKKTIGWNEDLKSSQEADLMFRLLQQNSKIIIDSEPLTIIRERESGQISTMDDENRVIRYVELRKRILHFFITEKPIYYSNKKEEYDDMFFEILRTLYLYNPKYIEMTYLSSFDKSFIPKVSIVNTLTYVLLFRVFGFRLAEKLKILYTRIIK